MSELGRAHMHFLSAHVSALFCSNSDLTLFHKLSLKFVLLLSSCSYFSHLRVHASNTQDYALVVNKFFLL